MYVLAIVSSLLIAVYLLYKRRYDYWKSKGVDGPPPSLVIGNLKLSRQFSVGSLFQSIYEQYGHRPFVGIYLFHRPALLVNDLELIKTILIKDFAHFTDHGLYFDKKTQPLINHLFNANGARWKALRTKLTPAFTSNKMKYMFDTMADCGNQLTDYLKKYADAESDVDIKEIVAKYTTDVIASCAFGIQSNCFEHPDAEFRAMGRKIVQFDLKRVLAIMLNLCAPDLQRLWNGKFVTDDVSEFFINMVKKTIEHREKNKVSRNDLMQLLIRLKNNESIDESSQDSKQDLSNVQLDTLEVASQAFGFFIGGFETASTTTSYLMYELAKNSQIQQKLRNEIDRTLATHGGNISYEAVNEMNYLNQVIEETLRMHATVPQLLRICVKDYVIPNTTVLIPKGTPLFISNQGIHKNSKYYPNPEVFNPENFAAENKVARDNFTFLPFGEGPRMCIGQRFAMLQVKIAVSSILRKYQINLPETECSMEKENPILLTPKFMMLKIKNC